MSWHIWTKRRYHYLPNAALCQSPRVCRKLLVENWYCQKNKKNKGVCPMKLKHTICASVNKFKRQRLAARVFDTHYYDFILIFFVILNIVMLTTQYIQGDNCIFCNKLDFKSVQIFMIKAKGIFPYLLSFRLVKTFKLEDNIPYKY